MENIPDTEIIDFVQCFFDFYPYDYQKAFLISCCKEKRVVGAWCRQSGKSTDVAAYSLYKCLTTPNYSILIIAPGQRQSSELYSKIRKMLSNCKLFNSLLINSTQTETNFPNGSRVKALPCGPEGSTIKGFTANTVIMEEAQSIKDNIVSEVITPMIAATDGQIIKIGTGKGKNHFWESAYGKETNYKLFCYDWTYPVKAGQITQEFIDEQRNNLTDMEFSTEYEAKFIEDADCYFKWDLINSCIEEYNIPEKMIPHHDYNLGVDIAGEGEDESVFISLLSQAGNCRVVSIDNYTKNLPREIVGMVRLLDTTYKYNKIILDKTGMGEGPVDWLREGNGGGDYRIEGLRFTIQSKMDIFSNLKKLMEQGKLKIPNHKKLIYQLLDFRYEVTSKGELKLHHSERGHDDYPDALALACWACKNEMDYHPSLG